MKTLTLRLRSKNNFLLLRNWVYFVPIFLKLTSQIFFKFWLADSNEVKTLHLFNFLIFMQLYRVKCIKYLRTRKYDLEHECEWNFSLVWLFLAIATLYLNCFDRVVLETNSEHWQLFQSVFFVLSRWTSTAPYTPSSWIWKKAYHTLKKYMCWMMIVLCQWSFSEQTEKLVRLLLYNS
jgi:hypothetical protein